MGIRSLGKPICVVVSSWWSQGLLEIKITSKNGWCCSAFQCLSLLRLCLMTPLSHSNMEPAQIAISEFGPMSTTADGAKGTHIPTIKTVPGLPPRHILLEILMYVLKRITYSEMFGKNGIKKANSNGVILLTKCLDQNLVHRNMLFHQREKHNTSCQHTWG